MGRPLMTLPRKSCAKAAVGSLGLPSACKALPVAHESRRIMLRWLDERFSQLAMWAHSIWLVNSTSSGPTNSLKANIY